MIKISTIEEFNQIASTEKRFLFLKHSLTCPISRSGYHETITFEASSPVPIYYLVVQESRLLSTEIANTYKVKHESPQILMFEDNKVVWTTSHYDISVTNLKNNVK